MRIPFVWPMCVWVCQMCVRVRVHGTCSMKCPKGVAMLCVRCGHDIMAVRTHSKAVARSVQVKAPWRQEDGCRDNER